MSTQKCAFNCAKARERRRRALESSANAQRYHRSGTWKSQSISDFEISDATEYQSFVEKISSFDSESTSSRASEENLDEASACFGGRKLCRTRIENNCNDRTPESRRRKSHSSERPETDSAATEHRSYNKTPVKNHQSQTRHVEEREKKLCPDNECSPLKSGVLFKRIQTSNSKKSSYDSDTQSELSKSESLLHCPKLCEQDRLYLPKPKSTCQSSCPKRAWLDKRREKRQAQLDRYMLNKGLNYFDDLCHCSLKCLAMQIYMDPFVKKTAASAAFFLLGIKLCFELDSWYIPF